MSAIYGFAVANLGWAATAVFTGSYFARDARTLRVLQMAGAALWLLYGVALRAAPIIVANVLVLGAATWTAFGRREREVAQIPVAPEPH